MSTSRQPERDRLLVFEIYGEARLHVPGRELIADERVAAGGKRCERAARRQVGQL